MASPSGGAVLLFVVDLRVGDVETVRAVLRGEDVATAATTEDAIAAGLAWVHVVAIGLGVLCLASALTFWRQSSKIPAPMPDYPGPAQE